MESKELSPIEDKITEQQFHSIWTQAVGMPDYNKRFFKELHSKLLNNGNICNEESRESTFKKQIQDLILELESWKKEHFDILEDVSITIIDFQSQLAEKDNLIHSLEQQLEERNIGIQAIEQHEETVNLITNELSEKERLILIKDVLNNELTQLATRYAVELKEKGLEIEGLKTTIEGQAMRLKMYLETDIEKLQSELKEKHKCGLKETLYSFQRYWKNSSHQTISNAIDGFIKQTHGNK